jgi:hypothetical protein
VLRGKNQPLEWLPASRVWDVGRKPLNKAPRVQAQAAGNKRSDKPWERQAQKQGIHTQSGCIPSPDSEAASAPETRFRSKRPRNPIHQTTHVIATASCVPNEPTQPASYPPAGAGQPVGIVIHYTRLVATGCFVLRLAYSDNCYNVIFPPTRLLDTAGNLQAKALQGLSVQNV